MIALWNDIAVEHPPTTRTPAPEPKRPANDPVRLCVSCRVKHPIDGLLKCQRCFYAP